jgi:hypothetical protein
MVWWKSPNTIQLRLNIVYQKLARLTVIDWNLHLTS